MMGLPADRNSEPQPRISHTIPLDDIENETNGHFTDGFNDVQCVDETKLEPLGGLQEESSCTGIRHKGISAKQQSSMTMANPKSMHYSKQKQGTLDLGENIRYYVYLESEIKPNESEKLLSNNKTDSDHIVIEETSDQNRNDVIDTSLKHENDIVKDFKSDGIAEKTSHFGYSFVGLHVLCLVLSLLVLVLTTVVVIWTVILIPQINRNSQHIASLYGNEGSRQQEVITTPSVCPSSVYTLNLQKTEDFPMSDQPLQFNTSTLSDDVEYSNGHFVFKRSGQYVVKVDFHIDTLTTLPSLSKSRFFPNELCLWLTDAESICKKVNVPAGVIQPLSITEILTLRENQSVILTIGDINILYIGPERNIIKIHALRC